MVNLKKISQVMKQINYGYINKEGKRYLEVNSSEFELEYYLQSPEELLKSKCGVCWDQVELERKLFSGYDIQTYFIIYYDDGPCPSHTFLTYKQEGKIYWYEHSWQDYAGVHACNNLDELLIDVAIKHLKHCQINCGIKKINFKNLCIYNYHQPKYGISCLEFMQHATKTVPIPVKINLNKR